MHLPVAIPALLCELIPGLGFREQLRDGSLTKSQYVFCEQPLANVVDGEKLSNPPGDMKGIQILVGILVHVVA